MEIGKKRMFLTATDRLGMLLQSAIKLRWDETKVLEKNLTHPKKNVVNVRTTTKSAHRNEKSMGRVQRRPLCCLLPRIPSNAAPYCSILRANAYTSCVTWVTLPVAHILPISLCCAVSSVRFSADPLCHSADRGRARRKTAISSTLIWNRRKHFVLFLTAVRSGYIIHQLAAQSSIKNPTTDFAVIAPFNICGNSNDIYSIFGIHTSFCVVDEYSLDVIMVMQWSTMGHPRLDFSI